MRRKLFFIAAAAALCALTVAGVWMYIQPTKPKFREVRVTRGSIFISISSVGTVQPQNRVDVKPAVGGRVEEVLVKEGTPVKKGQTLFWMSSIERAALLDAARSLGPEEYKQWETFYNKSEVVAPLDGTIIQRRVEPGQTFAASDIVMVMSDRLIVEAQVDETDLARVKVGQEAEIVLDAYSADVLAAKVDQIAYEAKTVNNVTTYTVDVLANHTPEHMRAGMTANVTFIIERRDGVLMLPNESLRRGEKGNTVVLVRNPDGKVAEVEVQTGLTDGKVTEISKGLQENQMVLTEIFTLKERSGLGENPFEQGPGAPSND